MDATQNTTETRHVTELEELRKEIAKTISTLAQMDMSKTIAIVIGVVRDSDEEDHCLINTMILGSTQDLTPVLHMLVERVEDMRARDTALDAIDEAKGKLH